MGGCMTATEVALAAFDHPRHESRACRSTSRDAEVKELSGLLPAALPRRSPQGAWCVPARCVRASRCRSSNARVGWSQGVEVSRSRGFFRFDEPAKAAGVEEPRCDLSPAEG